MKYALLSDIHGNVEALRAVISAAQSEGVVAYLIAGDLMGYYFRLPEVMDELDKLDTWIIRGNHEDMFFDWQNSPSGREMLEKKYGHSFVRNQQSLSASQIEYFRNLPTTINCTIEGYSILMCHGSPWDELQYIYPDADPDIVEKLFSYNEDLLVFGHSHYPVVWERAERFIVNPGSVGQPRDRKGGACWALWDSDNKKVSLRREFYDVTPVVEDCIKFSPDQVYLRDILIARRMEGPNA